MKFRVICFLFIILPSFFIRAEPQTTNDIVLGTDYVSPIWNKELAKLLSEEMGLNTVIFTLKEDEVFNGKRLRQRRHRKRITVYCGII